MIREFSSQKEFYREFLMNRGSFEPKDFGIDMSRTDLTDTVVGTFNEMYKSLWTIDELLLHPREAMRFCDTFRAKFFYHDLPDDLILRMIITRRKNPA